MKQNLINIITATGLFLSAGGIMYSGHNYDLNAHEEYYSTRKLKLNTEEKAGLYIAGFGALICLYGIYKNKQMEDEDKWE